MANNINPKINVAYFTEFGIRHTIITLDELIPLSKKFKLGSAEYVEEKED